MDHKKLNKIGLFILNNNTLDRLMSLFQLTHFIIMYRRWINDFVSTKMTKILTEHNTF